ncbi:JmjC domain-containing protein [Pseudomonas sp. GCM10022186]|uniref:JmjC domain-containing protein n=1 Tax=Pseudomonas sp. GCM10022186 TaxID=3252650 RepID=UPI0036187BEE
MKNYINFRIPKKNFIAGIADQDMHLVRGAVAPSLLKWADLNAALYYIDAMPPHVRVHKNGLVPESHYVEDCSIAGLSGKRLNAAALQDLLSNGATVVLNHIDTRLELVRNLCTEVAEYSNAETLANGYLAFSGRGSFGPHWDTHDVMAIQLIGRKRWKVYKPTFPLPLVGQTSKEHKAECPTEPVFDGILEAGDLLYLPRGWWHDALPIGETFHVAIGMYTANVPNFISWICRRALREHEELRGTLRPGCNFNRTIAVASKFIAELMNDPRQQIAFMDELKKSRSKPHQPFALESLVNSELMTDRKPLIVEEVS